MAVAIVNVRYTAQISSIRSCSHLVVITRTSTRSIYGKHVVGMADISRVYDDRCCSFFPPLIHCSKELYSQGVYPKLSAALQHVDVDAHRHEAASQLFFHLELEHLNLAASSLFPSGCGGC